MENTRDSWLASCSPAARAALSALERTLPPEFAFHWSRKDHIAVKADEPQQRELLKLKPAKEYLRLEFTLGPVGGRVESSIQEAIESLAQAGYEVEKRRTEKPRYAVLLTSGAIERNPAPLCDAVRRANDTKRLS